MKRSTENKGSSFDAERYRRNRLADRLQSAAREAMSRRVQYVVAAAVTTWPAFAEAMYLLHRIGGWPLQEALWRYANDGVIEVASPAHEDLPAIAELMRRYRDRPMDLADACLVQLADRRGFTRIFTLDSDFRIYRLSSGAVIESVP